MPLQCSAVGLGDDPLQSMSGFIAPTLLYRTLVDNELKIKDVKGNILHVVESPPEKAFPRLSGLVLKGF